MNLRTKKTTLGEDIIRQLDAVRTHAFDLNLAALNTATAESHTAITVRWEHWVKNLRSKRANLGEDTIRRLVKLASF